MELYVRAHDDEYELLIDISRGTENFLLRYKPFTEAELEGLVSVIMSRFGVVAYKVNDAYYITRFTNPKNFKMIILDIISMYDETVETDEADDEEI